MFKAFVSKSHPEFSSNRQQDAQEFFLHLVNLVEVSSPSSEVLSRAVRRVPAPFPKPLTAQAPPATGWTAPHVLFPQR